MLHQTALLNPKTSRLVQKRPFYNGNLNSETPRKNQIAVLLLGDVWKMYNRARTAMSKPAEQ